MTSHESITVSLEWAKKLKGAGWPQDKPLLFWTFSEDEEREVIRLFGYRTKAQIWFAAPTAEEILRRLPDYLETEYVLVTVRDHPEGTWAVNYVAISDNGVKYHPNHEFRARPCEADTLANAAAAMYCYLAQHNLLPLA